MAHNLLEEQYRRSQRTRLKNQQEQRLLQHEIDCPRGMNDIHRYRMEIVNREQKQICKERDRIRMGIESSLSSISPAWSEDPSDYPKHNAMGSNNGQRPHQYRDNATRRDSRSLKSQSGSTSQRETYSKTFEIDKEDSATDDQLNSLGLPGTKDENRSDTSSCSSYYCSDIEEESVPDINVLKAIMNGIVSDWEQDVLQTIGSGSQNQQHQGISQNVLKLDSKRKPRSEKTLERRTTFANRKDNVASNSYSNNCTQTASHRKKSNASRYSVQDMDSKTDYMSSSLTQCPSLQNAGHKASITKFSHRRGSSGDDISGTRPTDAQLAAKRYSLPHVKGQSKIKYM